MTMQTTDEPEVTDAHQAAFLKSLVIAETALQHVRIESVKKISIYRVQMAGAADKLLRLIKEFKHEDNGVVIDNGFSEEVARIIEGSALINRAQKSETKLCINDFHKNTHRARNDRGKIICALRLILCWTKQVVASVH